MLTNLYNFITISTYKNQILQPLVFISFIAIVYLVYKYLMVPEYEYVEGFDQKCPYMFKEGQSIYDEFYTEVYDKLFCNQERSYHEMVEMMDMTHPSINKSNMLDLGSGTGCLMNHFKSQGYNIHGLELSESMINKSHEQYDNLNIRQGNAYDPLTFEPNTFSHVMCTNMTVYEFEDKYKLFNNVNRWLKHNGYFIVHLVNIKEFDTTIPAAKPKLIMNPQRFSKERITRSKIEFDGYSYVGSYDIKPKRNKIIVNELFEDFENKQKREQEHTLYTEPINTIISIAQKCGFHNHAKAKMLNVNGDNYQFLYVFEKIH
jgi:ubiquinone/menaquinone biosynthesis C-methylase UbiE